MSKECEYQGGCPIEPLVAQQAALISERDRPYASVRETNNSQEVDSLIARAQALEAQIERKLRQGKTQFTPVKIVFINSPFFLL